MSSVELELPPAWSRFPIAPDGARRAQRQLLEDWYADHTVPADRRETATTCLVRESRQASREGIGFAAVLFLDLDDPGADAQHQLVVGSLTVSFRTLPHADDPAVAAQGTLDVLRGQRSGGGYATRRLELVGLGRDSARPAVLLREQLPDPETGTRVAVSQVLWLIPGSHQLASVAVATPNRDLAPAFTELALGVASGLRVTA